MSVINKESMEGLVVKSASLPGYEVMASFGSWKTAVITYAERFDRRNLYRMERHMETDEVFVLMDGSATLFIGDECREVEMAPFVFYNVKKAAWHAICCSTDAKVLICENDDTGILNTEYKETTFE